MKKNKRTKIEVKTRKNTLGFLRFEKNETQHAKTPKTYKPDRTAKQRPTRVSLHF
jgi:hypothetical protein